jgi:thiosulfate/3-mercaptopyruvate sulfurtransferase
MESLVSTEWLAGEIGKPDLRILDASWFLPDASRDGRTEYESAHIPGASFVDLDSLSDPDSELPHMLPSAALFAARMRSLDVGDHDRIVLYDNSPLHTAARVWWMLRLFGARQVAILDGGFPLWLAEGRPIESGTRETCQGHFTPGRGDGGVADKADVLALGEETTLVDARPAARFRGDNPEPRPGLAAGHIPGSRSLPQSELFEPDGRWKRGEALRAAFAEAGVDLSKPMVTTCGSGVTAAVLLFGAHLLGKQDVSLYDGSWTEWGSDPATPKATGPT